MYDVKHQFTLTHFANTFEYLDRCDCLAILMALPVFFSLKKAYIENVKWSMTSRLKLFTIFSKGLMLHWQTPAEKV